MDAETVTELLTGLCAQLGLEVGQVRRDEVRCWRLSGVERLHLSDGGTLIFKYAAAPFTDEAVVLRHVRSHGVPVPRLFASVTNLGRLGMLMEDLGDPVRRPTLVDAAAAAASVHSAPTMSGLRIVDATTLAALPGSCLDSLAALAERGRWKDASDVSAGLTALGRVAEARAQGARVSPFGLCHSEFHPTSVHIGPTGWKLLDWARAFTGPGLLDLASWQGTTEAADLDALRALLDAYIAEGGPAEMLAERGGLAAERWAVGWHRLWVIEWYLRQCTTWVNDEATDPVYQRVIRRHLDEALRCLDSA
ncbi:MAG: phosphotransferase family protein [Nocardioidaceae bacterium]